MQQRKFFLTDFQYLINLGVKQELLAWGQRQLALAPANLTNGSVWGCFFFAWKNSWKEWEKYYRQTLARASSFVETSGTDDDIRHCVRIAIGRWTTIFEEAISFVFHLSMISGTISHKPRRKTDVLLKHQIRAFTDLGILIEAVLSATPALNFSMDAVSCSPVRRRALSKPPLGS